MTNIRRPNILFICATNSTCSIIAEALTNHLGEGACLAYSAGPRPKAMANPAAINLLKNYGVPTARLYSKSLDEFLAPNAPEMDFVVTLGKFPEGRTRHLWPGHPILINWPIPDPKGAEGLRLERGLALVTETLELRIKLLLSLQFYRDNRGHLHIGGLDKFASAIEAASLLSIPQTTAAVRARLPRSRVPELPSSRSTAAAQVDEPPT
jgi:arsenate reductase